MSVSHASRRPAALATRREPPTCRVNLHSRLDAGGAQYKCLIRRHGSDFASYQFGGDFRLAAVASLTFEQRSEVSGMNSKKVMGFSAAALCIGLAVPCFGDVVSVDETTCISGSVSVPCTTPSTLTDFQTSGTTFNYVFTLPDHDNFLIYGSTSWDNDGSGDFGFGTAIGAQYLGNAVTGSVPSQAETIRDDDSQFLNLDGSDQGTFNENDTIYFNGPIGGGSQATAYYTVDGQPLPTMTFSPPSGSQSESNVFLPGLTEPFLID